MKRTIFASAAAIAIAVSSPMLATAGDDDVISDQQMVVIKAEPGRAVAKAMSPTWCDVADEKGGFVSGRMSRYIKNVTENSWSAEVLGEGGAGLCRNPTHPSWQKQTGYFMQVWMDWTGLGQKEVEVSISQRVQVKRWKALQEKTCAALKTNGETSDLDKLEIGAKRKVLGCGGEIGAWITRAGAGGESTWFLDRHQDPQSEMVRLHLVLGCLRDPFSRDNVSAPNALAAYALCGVDARRLDLKKLERELSDGKYNDYAKTMAREAHSRARLETAAYEASVQALAKKDPDYKKILIDAPEGAWKAWSEESAKHKATLAALLEFDVQAFGPSQKATDGCLPGLRAGFRAYMTSGGVKTEEDAKARAASPIGAAILARLMLCEARSNNFNTGEVLTQLYLEGRQAQGVRYGVYYAVVAAVAEVKADRTKFPMDLDMFGQLAWGPYVEGTYAEVADAKKRVGNTTAGQKNGSFMEDIKGTIKSVKKIGDEVEIVFKTEKWKESTHECHDTNKIWRIDADGKIHYYPSCKPTGQKTVSHTEKTTYIPADAAEGIKAGMLLIGRGDFPFNNGEKRLGYPFAVYDSNKMKKLISWYGIKL